MECGLFEEYLHSSGFSSQTWRVASLISELINEIKLTSGLKSYIQVGL